MKKDLVKSRLAIVERKEGYPSALTSEESVKKIPREKEASLRHKSQRNREDTVAAWLLARYMMGDLHVAYDEYGKGYLTDRPDIHFNLTHCQSGTACVVSQRECGVDMEGIIAYKSSLARHICTEEELKMLEEANDKDKLLTRLWTIKEAYVKMLGIGIAYGLKNVNTCEMDEDVHVMENDEYCLAVVERKDENGTAELTTQYIEPTEML